MLQKIFLIGLTVVCVVLTIVFGIPGILFFLINLFFGAGIGATFFQVGYTFLIGCMLAVTLLKTRNIWICVVIHFLFDIGGIIVTDWGSGHFQDLTFWILTAIAGAVCTIHIIITLFKNGNEFKPDSQKQ